MTDGRRSALPGRIDMRRDSKPRRFPYEPAPRYLGRARVDDGSLAEAPAGGGDARAGGRGSGGGHRMRIIPPEFLVRVEGPGRGGRVRDEAASRIPASARREALQRLR